ncbi:TonB-dependent receptor [Sphingomonas bacterium]|uniref:TonB-dependent receptor n=1 Tax=Sphingomonas bacterium TaxID=1895847 RepID=UPI00157739C7|nr:TonB-dependent receptor [Sphingomonas bacterium]
MKGYVRAGWPAAAALAQLAATAQGQTAPAQTAPTATTSADDVLVVAKLDRLVTPTATGSRLGLSALETPASVATIDGEESRARGDLTIVDAVTRAPGITSVANPGNGYTALAARGFSDQGSILQLVDGIRLFPVAGTITFPTDPWNVDRIEVLSGPASVLYGQGALGGAINTITKKPDPLRTKLDGEVAFGSQNTAHVAAGTGGPINSVLSYRLDASYRRSDGIVKRGKSDSIALAGAIRYAPTDRLTFSLRDDYGYQRPTKYFGTPLLAGRLDTSIRDNNYNVADADVHFRDNRTTLTTDWQVSSALSFSNAAYRLTSYRLFKDLENYCYVAASGDCANGDDGPGAAFAGLIQRYSNLGIIHDQTQYGDQGSVKLSTPLGGGISNDLVGGFDVNIIKLIYSNDFGSDPQVDVVNPRSFNPGTYFDTQGIAPRFRTRTHEYSVFGEDRVKFGDQLSLVGGIRAEWDNVARYNITYSATGAARETNAFPNDGDKALHNVTWRVGGVYQPAPTLSLYAQYATGVDPLGTLTTFTTNAQQFYFTNATGDQVEAGVKASFLGGRGAATLAAYRIVKHNLVAQRTPTSPVEQVGQQSSKGIEASVTLDLAAGFGIDANATILDARYDNFVSGGTNYTGHTPPNVPESAGNLWLRWSGIDRLQARLGLRYVGRSFSDDANQYRVPGYAVVDGSVSYAFTRQLALDVRLSNLLDKDYAVTTYANQQWILGRPRSVDVAVRARF